HSADRFVGEKSSAPAAGPSNTSPPWSGSRTGEHRRRRGGGASEASQETHRDFPAVLRTAPPRHFVPLPHSADRFVGEKSSAPAAGPSNTSPPWSGSGTGEHRRRRGGGPSEASQETHRDFPAVLRTAPPRHFVPLPHSADRFVGEKSSAPAAGPSNTSPPWSGSGTGESRRRRGGGASEASQETHRDFPAVLRTAPPRH